LTEQHAAKLAPLLSRFDEESGASIQVTALSPGDLYALLAVELLHETQAVDVVSLSDDWIPSLGRSAVLLSDADLVADEVAGGIHDRVGPLGRSLADDQLVAAAWSIDVGFTAVNGGALGMTSSPRRWDEFVDLVEASGGGGLALAGASGDPAAATFRAILSGYGKDIVEEDTNRPTVTDYDARQAVGVMTRLQAQTSVSPLAVDDRAMGDLLRQGAATSSAHVWASTWLDVGTPPGWTLLPPLRASAPRGSRLLRAWLLAIPETSPVVDLSRTFVAWMLAPATQRSLLDAGLIPSSKAVLGDVRELANRPAFDEIVRGLLRSKARPRLRAFPEINRVCGEAVATILAGNASASVAFHAADAEMRRILEREGELRL
jgi:ABC-type glycerol-3-phosphate transport system substrate-binding protein